MKREDVIQAGVTDEKVADAIMAMHEKDIQESQKAPAAPLTIEQVKKMTPGEINRNWDAVQLALSSQK